MTKPLPKIEPCPFCGKECWTMRLYHLLEEDDTLDDVRHNVKCKYCQYSSGERKTIRGAINAHNSVSKKARG